VDLVVEVLSPRDSVLQSVDSPNGRNGPENVEIFPAQAGRYTVRVRPFDDREPEGHYTLDVTTWRDASTTRALLVARRLARDSAAAWLRTRSAALDSSLAPLDTLATRVDVLGLGEATHGSREFANLRLRLTRYLIERLGYRIVAIEGSTSRLAVLDRYVRGEIASRDSIRAVLESGWIGRRALREIVAWLRQWNDAHAATPVRLVGLDPQDNALAREDLRDFITRAYPEAVGRYTAVERELAAADSQTWVFGNSSVDSSARRFLQELSARLETDTPLLRQLHDSSLVRAGGEAARQLLQFADFNAAEDNTWSRSRDWHMAANLLRAIESLPGTKVVYWAHNAHVAAPPDRAPTARPMGAWLRAALGCRYGAVAVTFDSGGFVAQIPNDLEDDLAVSTLPRAPDDAIEGVLRTVRPRATIAAWNCESRAATAPDWLRRPQRMHWVGALFRPGTDPSEAFRTVRLLDDFDGLVFIPRVSADEVPTDRPLVPARRPRQP
jgi:erythromycin esterase